MNKTLLLIFSLLVAEITHASSDKLLDNFSSVAPYYTSGTSASITPSIDNSVYFEGNSSLKISYTLNGIAGNYVEVFRSYTTNTLDLSFDPEGLSLKVLGNAGNTDVFKFMLYEDHDMDGNPFEAGDEIYEFTSSSILSSASWTLLTMPYSSFTKFGGGSGTLDLNRVGAWRIFVTNSGMTSGEIFYVDDLRQSTTYTAPASGTAALKGSFIQLWNTAGCNCGQLTQAQWEAQFQQMKDACMGQLVIQYGVYADNAWYSPSTLGYVTYTNPTLGRIMAAADAKGMEIYLGLYFDETWNSSDKTLSATYSSLLTKQEDVIDELWNLFSSHTSLKGWYIPQEINDLEWQASAPQGLLASYLQSVASYAKGKDNTKKVLIAPFFGPNRPADDLKTWWETVLTTATAIDVLYFQDGVGTTTKDVDTDIPHYFSALRQACQNKGKIFGATIESFQQTDGWPINGNNFAAVPASINRLTGQLREANRHTNATLQFEWAYMQPALSTASQELYDDYKTYVDCGGTTFVKSKSESIATIKEFQLYPVPGDGKYFLKHSGTKTIKGIQVFDSKGSLVFHAVGNLSEEINIVLPENNKGVFWVKIETDKGVEMLPLIQE